MTIQAVHDKFLAELATEQMIRGAGNWIPPEKMVLSWISEGQQEINDRLNVLVTYSDVSITAATTFTTFSLPSNFGKLIKVEISGTEMELTNVAEFMTTAGETGTPTQAAAYINAGGTWLLALNPQPSAAATARAWYVIDTLYYNPDDTTTAQNWGSFAGTSTGLTGNIKLPERYGPLIVTWMIGRVFPEYRQVFEAQIGRYKSSFQETVTPVRHRMGGF